MRILYLVPAGPAGTVSMVFAHAEIGRVAASGVSVETVSIVTKPTISNLIRQILVVRERCQGFRPDIVHAHFGTFTGFVAALGATVPVVITFRGSDLNPSPNDGAVRNVLQKLLSQLATLRTAGIILVSPGLRPRLWRERGVVRVIPSGVDLQRFVPGDKAKARAQLGWTADEWVVLFNAGIAPKGKRLDLATEAVNVALKSIPSARLHVLNGRTPHAELPACMIAADCLLITSDFEGSPDIVKEALACNLPVVSVDVGDVAERLDGVPSARIVARDPATIAAALIEMCRSTKPPEGRAQIAELDAWRIRDRILALYQDVLEKRTTTRPHGET